MIALILSRKCKGSVLTGSAFGCMLLFHTICLAPVFAQTRGTVTGIVADADTGRPLPGANVLVKGTAFGTATASDGSFRLIIRPGDYTLVFSYIGYESQEVDVPVTSSVTTQLDIDLAFGPVAAGEVVVTAQAAGQAAAINQQLASNTIVNIVSSARIQELPDQNAAETTGRLPGVSILRDAGEGQKVVIRGLSPKYNSITVDGDRLPATDLLDRSVDLNMISPDLLEGIEVYKSLTPDRDADAIGGTVNFTLREAPTGFRSSLKLQNGYSSQEASFEQYRGSLTLSNRFLNDKLGVLATGSAQRVDRSSDVFNAAYFVAREATPEEESAPIRVSNLTLVDRLETRERYGSSVLLDYRLPNGKISTSNFFGYLDRDEVQRQIQYSVSNFRTRYNLRDRDIAVSILSNAVRGEHNVSNVNIGWRLSRSSSLQKSPYDHLSQFHELAAFDSDKLDEEGGPDAVPAGAKNQLDETFLYQNEFNTAKGKETDLTAQLDIDLDFKLGSWFAGYLKVGGKYRGKERTQDFYSTIERWDSPAAVQFVVAGNEGEAFDLTSQGFIGLTNYLDPGYDTGSFLDGDFVFQSGLNQQLLAQFYDQHKDRYTVLPLADLNDFRNTEDIYAGYVMAELNLGRKLMVLPGIRYEHTATSFDAKIGRLTGGLGEGEVRDTTSAAEYASLFPMIHVRYKFFDWLDIRLARTESLARPEFSFISPKENIDVSNRLVDRGNPVLKPTHAINYDAYLSIYTNRFGLLTVGSFYKELEDLVYLREKVVLAPESERLPAYTRGYTLLEPINNVFDTIVKGYEIEWQTNFAFLSKPFNGLVLNANYARIDAETQFPNYIVERETEPPFGFVGIDTFRVSVMPNQPRHIINVALGYDIGGFSGRISMLTQGRSLHGIGTRIEEDGFTEAYRRWDISLKQELRGGIGVFLNFNNLSDQPDKSTITIGYPTAQEFYGWTIDLGLRYRY